MKRAKQRFAESGTYYLLTDFSLNDLPINPCDHGFQLLSNAATSTGQTNVFLCIFEDDDTLLDHLQTIRRLPNAYYYMPRLYMPAQPYYTTNRIAKSVLKSTHQAADDNETYDLADYTNILQALEITRNIPGVYVEIGVYKGLSAFLALSYMKQAGISKESYFLDLFEGFTYKEAQESSDASWYGRFGNTSEDKVKAKLKGFERHHVEKTNIITDGLPANIDAISCANIDVDMYEAVQAAMHKCAPLVSPGGIMIIEDQGHMPYIAGAALAVSEFLDENKGFLPIHLESGQVFLIKQLGGS